MRKLATARQPADSVVPLPGLRPWPVIDAQQYDEARTRITSLVPTQRPACPGLKTALREVRQLGDFAVGHVYLAAPVLGQLVPAHIWELAEPSRYGAFVRATTSTVLAPGVGLPGQAAATGRPVTLPSIENDARQVRARVAVSVGLRSACAFPVLRGEQVVAVLEFLAAEPRQPDPAAEASVGGLVDGVASALAGPDFEELVSQEVALAQAANLLRHGSVRTYPGS